MRAIEVYDRRGKTLFHIPDWRWLYAIFNVIALPSWGMTSCRVRFAPRLWERV